MADVVVVGAGTWGVVFASLLANNGHNVTVFARNEKQVKEFNEKHVHEKLPGVLLAKEITFTSDLKNAVKDKSIIVIAVPSTAFRDTVKKIIPFANANAYYLSLTKGMEDKTLYTMSEILEDELKKSLIINDRIVVLSGPTHAEEVGKAYPSTIVSASKNEEYAKYVQDVCMNERFRVYTNIDIKGVEICAAFKNVIAIASGILAGLGFGDNIKAALLTRGLAEMIRVGDAFSCKKDTFYGLAGVGDIIVTATSIHSRNFRFGKLIGEGNSTKDALEKIGMVVEGVNFVPKAMEIQKKYDLDLPISSGTYEIVYNGEDPREILRLLMVRSKKSE